MHAYTDGEHDERQCSAAAGCSGGKAARMMMSAGVTPRCMMSASAARQQDAVGAGNVLHPSGGWGHRGSDCSVHACDLKTVRWVHGEEGHVFQPGRCAHGARCRINT